MSAVVRLAAPLLPLAVATLAASAALSLAACDNPVHSDAVEALGPEAPGVRPGPEHRGGQPCLVCHGEYGPGPEFGLAGTVYRTLKDKEPLEGAIVTVTQSDGKVTAFRTNRAGNFFLKSREGALAYPLQVEVEGDGKTVTMNSLVNGSGSCATCHRDDGSRETVPAVYIRRE